ncbi:NAD(P)-binding protein [Penicillium malachiteum]|nr:NAD(P)-binding protein [Penicillium malachiteum]
MSTNFISKVAIIGATGRIGGAFAEALVKTGKHTITGLTREGSDGVLPEGVNGVPVNYDDETSLVNAMKGHQFLVITLGARVEEEVHKKILAAASKAGIPYIMPNAYGYPLDHDTENVYAKSVVQRVKDTRNTGATCITLPCGFWYEWSLATGEQWFGFRIKQRKVTFFDDGKRVITVSTWNQCGRALAALLSLPESGASPSIADYVNDEVRIYSFRVSQRDMLDSLHRVLGTTDADWEITYESAAQRIKGGAAEMAQGSILGFGKVLYGGVFLASNELSDFANTMSTSNDALGLPTEELDEATKRTVEMVEGGWNPFNFPA